jgi:hypothetical protein
MSCDNCFTSARGMDEALSNIKVKARAYAEEIQKPVAIYKEGYELYYTEAGRAIDSGYQIVQIVLLDKRTATT